MATESFFSNASLAYLASAGAGKDGKAYSIKPTNGTGDFTFSRGTDLTATRVGPTGLIEKGRENVLKQSNQFNTSPWVLSSGATLTSGIADPDGGTNAWQLNFDGTANARIEQQVSVVNGGVYTFSFYGRVSSGTKDINVGAVGSLTTKTLTTEWQRIEFFGVTIATITFPQIRTKDTSVYSIEIYKAQFEAGTIATDYIESGATTGKAGLLEDEPRFDYSGGATCPSLLLEPQRVNLVKYSEYFEGTGWTLGSGALTNNTTETTSPEGLNNALKLQTLYNNPSLYHSQIVVTASTQYTFSFYAKGNLNTPKLAVYDESNGAFIAVDIAYSISSDSWTRIKQTITTPVGCTSLRVYPIRSTGTGTIYFWGAQVEAGSYPTSYIPNHSGGSATRTAEKQEVTGLTSSVLNQSEGSFYIELQTLSTDAGRVVITSYPTGASNDTIRFIFTNQINFGLVSAGTLPDSTNPTSAKVKVAGTYSGTELKLCVNGGAVQKSSGNFSFTNQPTKIYTHAFVDTIRLFADIDQMLYFPTALSDADMITLTT